MPFFMERTSKNTNDEKRRKWKEPLLWVSPWVVRNYIRMLYCILPPYLKIMSFWTATRSPKFNFDFLFFIKIFIAKWYIYTFMKIFFKTNLFIWFFVFWNSTTSKLFMIYVPNVWLKPCPERHSFRVWREYITADCLTITW